MSRILQVLYGTPDLGNKSDPVDELVHIILSKKTYEEAYQKAFRALKSRFPRGTTYWPPAGRGHRAAGLSSDRR